MTLTVSVWVGKAEDSGRGEPVRKKCVRGSRSGETGPERSREEEGMAIEGEARDHR